MIRTLEDAWEWYLAVRTLARDMKGLAGKWNDPDLEKVLGRDNRLRDRTAAELQKKSTMILDDLDDLAILVMFSVFEATVRARTRSEVARETEQLQHPAVLHAVKELKDAIENGSFFRVMEAYKKMDEDLNTQVNQVRRFRNWVAHGRRDQPENNVNPEIAIERLRRYLEQLAEVEAAPIILLSPIDPPRDAAPEPG